MYLKRNMYLSSRNTQNFDEVVNYLYLMNFTLLNMLHLFENLYLYVFNRQIVH